MGRPHIRVVGYLSIDTVYRPGVAPEQAPGGAALYAALGARHAGASVSLNAVVGEDYPQAWLHDLEAMDIDVSRVQRRSGPTRTTALHYGRDGQRSSPHFSDPLWWDRTNALSPLVGDDLAEVDALVACPMTTTSLSTLVRRAVVAGVPVVADTSAAFVSDNAQVMLQLLQELAVFAPSREETQLLLPDYDDDAAAVRLARQGVHLLLKCGQDGAIVVSARGESVQRIPAPPAAVVDPTGAGDATVGALAAHWAAGSDFLAAASASLLTGALATTGLGPVALGLVQTEPA